MRAFKFDSEKNVCSLVFRIDRPPQIFLAVSSFSRLLRSFFLFLPYLVHLVLQKGVVVMCHNYFYFCHTIYIFCPKIRYFCHTLVLIVLNFVLR